MVASIRVYNKKNKLIRYRTASCDRKAFLHGVLASAKGKKWYIKVVYGYDTNVFGKRTLFKNEGTYYKLSDTKQALRAFMEKD